MSEKSSKPRPRPDCADSTIDDTKPAVANPAALNASASVGTSGASAREMLSRIPCCAGSSPVKIETCDGRVIGAGTVASIAIAPSRASRSMFGVAISTPP